MDKNGVAIKLSVINLENSHTLRISHDPGLLFYVAGLPIGLALALVVAQINPVSFIMVVFLLAINGYNLYRQRAFVCTINKETGWMIYSRSGFLMSRFDERKAEYTVSKINRLEIQRHLRGGTWVWADHFQIFLVLDRNQRLALSPSNLDFAECHEFAEQIRAFLGNGIQIKAVN